MRKRSHLLMIVKKVNKGYISLKKKPTRTNLITNAIIIKNNINSIIFHNNEISIKEILTTMLSRTNKIYDNFELILINIKLDKDENYKRTKIIKNLKDFISNNIAFKSNNNDFNFIFCNVIYFFDFLIIQNKKYKLLSSFEKLALGALILVIKFNKLQDKLLIKKYKSVFIEKYMTLEEIKKIEILSLKLINYYIIQPNPINYLNFLYKNIFTNNKGKDMYYISKLIISILKTIMFYSNDYIQYHPFYLSCFIIKFCFEQNQIDGFHKTLTDYFDMNIRIFRSTFQEFLKQYNYIMKINLNLEMSKKVDNKLLFQKAEVNSDIIHKIKKIERFNSNNRIISSNSFLFNSCEKDKKEKNNRNHLKINGTINSMNNTYYKKFLDNYLLDRSNGFSANKNQTENSQQISNVNYLNIKVADSKNEDKITVNKKFYTIESPKKCGIRINYRIKKKPNDINNKMVFFNIRKICEKTQNINKIKINDTIKKENNLNEYKENKENNENIENIKNNEINNRKIFHNKSNDLTLKVNRGISSSIRKCYQRKFIRKLDENNKSYNNNLLNNIDNNILNEKLICKENKTIEEGKKVKINSYLEKYNNFNRFQRKNMININDSNLKSTINQTESSNSYFDEINKEKKRFHKFHIRNFYKQKNSILFNLSNFESKQILVK